MNLFVSAALLSFIFKAAKKGMMALATLRRRRNAIMTDLGEPEGLLTFVNDPTRFDCCEIMTAPKGSSIACPKPNDYAWRL